MTTPADAVPLLGYQIVILTLLGGLAAGAAGFFGVPMLLDDGSIRKRLCGLGGALCGLTIGLMLWGWALGGYPLALFDRLAQFWRAIS